jgi:hypothetical protein
LRNVLLPYCRCCESDENGCGQKTYLSPHFIPPCRFPHVHGQVASMQDYV